MSKTPPRTGTVKRKTKETDIAVKIRLQSEPKGNISTGIGFLDHMLTLMAHHGGFYLDVSARGDVEVDSHHTTEDIGICMGQAFLQAAGDYSRLVRYGHSMIVMDEALAQVALDFSGRPYLAIAGKDIPAAAAEINPQLLEVFFRGLCNHARMTMHIRLLEGTNTHHMLEAAFKAAGRALGTAAGLRTDSWSSSSKDI